MPSNAKSSFRSRNPLHVKIEMKNINLQVTLLITIVQKGVGTPFPSHYTPGYTVYHHSPFTDQTLHLTMVWRELKTTYQYHVVYVVIW